MNRRGFLKGILAAGVAPYVVTSAGVLMPVKKIIEPEIWFTQSGSGAHTRTVQDALRAADAVLYGDGIHDDTAALQAFVDGKRVVYPDGRDVGGSLINGVYRMESIVHINNHRPGPSGLIMGNVFDGGGSFHWKVA